jgi:hypothetical protein
MDCLQTRQSRQMCQSRQSLQRQWERQSRRAAGRGPAASCARSHAAVSSTADEGPLASNHSADSYSLSE